MTNTLVSISIALFVNFFALETSSTKYVNTANHSFDSCVLFIYSPYNCFCRITYTVSGSAKIESFVKTNVDGLEKDSTIESNTFKIRAIADLAKMNKIIEKIKTEDTVHSRHMFDTYGFKLIVDQKKYIDVYGQNEHIDNLLRVFSKYINESDDKCGYFRLFKQINSH